VQEALTNVVRHAQASLVDVLLERRGEQVMVIIEDNGAGFDTDATLPAHGWTPWACWACRSGLRCWWND